LIVKMRLLDETAIGKERLIIFMLVKWITFDDPKISDRIFKFFGNLEVNGSSEVLFLFKEFANLVKLR
jgi:hypothetical protein